ncbi:MAG: hypothetical protein DRG63_14185 [Deltaproteobacteria bacterium]|nr:MAG: hypothetical protein DRG63_14185 [Deltaproteobacteria bacterium]
MNYSEAKLGRVFTISLEHGEIIHEALEQLAKTDGINSGVLVLLEGLDNGSTLVVGPEDGQVRPYSGPQECSNVSDNAGEILRASAIEKGED